MCSTNKFVTLQAATYNQTKWQTQNSIYLETELINQYLHINLEFTFNRDVTKLKIKKFQTNFASNKNFDESIWD